MWLCTHLYKEITCKTLGKHKITESLLRGSQEAYTWTFPIFGSSLPLTAAHFITVRKGIPSTELSCSAHWSLSAWSSMHEMWFRKSHAVSGSFLRVNAASPAPQDFQALPGLCCSPLNVPKFIPVPSAVCPSKPNSTSQVLSEDASPQVNHHRYGCCRLLSRCRLIL